MTNIRRKSTGDLLADIKRLTLQIAGRPESTDRVLRDHRDRCEAEILRRVPR